MAATLAEGETVIENAAREPEVVDLADMLMKMGAKIEGAGTSTIRVQGVSKLHGVEHEIIADRIEAGTYMIAAAITGGEILVTGCVPEHLGRSDREDAAGGRRRDGGRSQRASRVRSNGNSARDRHHHGGISRLRHRSAGAVHGADDAGGRASPSSRRRSSRTASCTCRSWCAWARIFGSKAGRRSSPGNRNLTGAQVIASDLRASASLVLAALAAKGETVVDRVYHIDRGYENIEGKLSRVGARVKRIDDNHELTS